MFLDNSRYAAVPHEEVRTRHGRSVSALKLRMLPPTPGTPHSVNQDERLDLLAHAKYGDGTRYWHIADANSALQASALTRTVGAHIDVPAS
jgi:hypothetical protein